MAGAQDIERLAQVLRLQQRVTERAVMAGQHLLAQQEAGVAAGQRAHDVGQQLQVLLRRQQNVRIRRLVIRQAGAAQQLLATDILAARVVEQQRRLVARHDKTVIALPVGDHADAPATATDGADDTGWADAANTRPNSASNTSASVSALALAWRTLMDTRTSLAW